MEEIERIIDEIKRENEEEEQGKSDLTEENTKDSNQEILEETESVSEPEKQTEVRRQYRMDNNFLLLVRYRSSKCHHDSLIYYH